MTQPNDIDYKSIEEQVNQVVYDLIEKNKPEATPYIRAIFEILDEALQERDAIARQQERERIINLLDWRNRTDGVEFHDGDNVVEWIDEKLQALTPNDKE